MMIKSFWWPLTLIGFLMLAACGRATPTPQAGPDSVPGDGLVLADCQLTAPGFATRLPAQCGTLTVPEDAANAQGRRITLRVAVIPATGRNPAPDPLFFISGGPGQAATETYIQLAQAFREINQQRAVVLVDQRGTGQSHPLDCAAPVEDAPTQELTAAVQTCLTALDADPHFYTTLHAIADLDAVRAALGYEQINIYGVSYGTRVALAYLRQYPAQTRAVILDGVLPMEAVAGLDVARDAQRALNLMFDRCTTDPACAEAFPTLREEFAALTSELQAAPIVAELTHPITGAPITQTFTYTDFASTLRLSTYSPEMVSLMPLMLHTAYAEDNWQPLVAQGLMVTEDLRDSFSEGMGNTVLCSEDEPFFTDAQASAANAETYMGDIQTTQLRQLCALWPHTAVPAEFKQPVTSDKPVLLLSGEADPVTPPGNGDAAAKTLANSLHIVAPGQGHIVIGRGCIIQLAADFIKAGSVQGLDTACVQTLAAPPFFVNFSGPVP